MQKYIDLVKAWESNVLENQELSDLYDFFAHLGKPSDVTTVRDAMMYVLKEHQDFGSISLALIIGFALWASREEDYNSAGQVELLAKMLEEEKKSYTQDASTYHSINFAAGELKRLVVSNMRDKWHFPGVFDYEVTARPQWTEIQKYIDGLRFHIESTESSNVANVTLEFLRKKRHRFS